MNLQFFMMVPDQAASAPGLYFPSRGAYEVRVGQQIPIQGMALAINKNRLGADLPVYFLAVHEPNPAGSLAADALIGGIASLIIDAFTAGYGSLIRFALEFASNLLLPPVMEWITGHEHNVIGEQIYALRRSKDWESGNQITLVTQDGGMEITFEVSTVRKPVSSSVSLNSPVSVAEDKVIQGSITLKCPHPQVQITSPESGEVLRGQVTVVGTADFSPFLYYKISIKPAHLPNKEQHWLDLTPCQLRKYGGKGRWTCIEHPVQSGPLYSFYVNEIPWKSGDCHLRLRVVDGTGNYGRPGERDCIILVQVN